ncbi:MAG TPA: ABC transporter substrate-binding protein [Anaerolineae bacterium]|nr:ABC transporter substrate-binding protein [Anaerolineae bacterium]
MRKAWKYVAILLMAIALIGPTGCAGKSGAVRVGLLFPMTGPVPTYGQSSKEGAELAIKEWNDKGGVLGKEIEWVLEDGGCDGATATDAANKLIDQDGVKFIVGEVCSSASIPVSEIANPKQILQISPTSTNPQVTVGKPYVFRACFLDPFQGGALASFAIEDLKATSAAVLYVKGNDYVMGLAEYFKGAFEARGGTVLVYEAYTAEDTDFSAILSKVADAAPDILFLPDYYNKVNLIGKQAKERGVTATLLGGDGWDSADLDMSAVDGGYHSNHYSAADPRAVVTNFLTKYRAEFGKAPDALAVLAYDATNVLLAAIEKAGSTDTAVVRDTLAGIQFEGVAGVITFDAEGDPVKTAAINQVTGGEFKFVKWVSP